MVPFLPPLGVFLLLAGGGAGGGAVRLVVLARLSPGELGALERRAAAFEQQHAGAHVAVRPFGRHGPGRVPHPARFDLLAGWPLWRLAARAHDLARLEGGRRWAVYGTALYALHEAGEPPRPLAAWAPRGNARVLLPDPESEPEVLEAYAALVELRGEEALRRLLAADAGIALLHSPAIRRRLARRPPAAPFGFLRLARGTPPPAPILPAARTGIAVSRSARDLDLARALLAFLVAARPPPPKAAAPFPAAKTLERVAALVSGESTAPPPQEWLPSWLETVLLLLFGGLFLTVLWRGRR